MKIEHIAWQVGDAVAVAAWYRELFDFAILRKVEGGPQTHFLADASGRVVIEIYNNPAVSVPDYHAMDPLLLHIAFQSDNPAADRDRLLAGGATLTQDVMVTPAGDLLVMLRDPWGFAVQLVKRRTPMLPA